MVASAVTRRTLPREAASADRAAQGGLGGVIGAAISLLIHLGVIGAALSGYTSHQAHHRDQPGVGTSVAASDTEPTMTLIFLEEPGIGAKKDEPREDDIASRAQTASNPYLVVAHPTPTLESSEKAADDKNDTADTAEASASDQLGHARLFGRYMGQIQARIERAWLRPRTPIGLDTFECRVQIAQNNRGEVLEVTLRDCAGDLPWQVSLVHAIERASPLPAPPDPAVFTEALRLTFHSQAYVAENGDEGFEPVMPTRVAAVVGFEYLPALAPASDSPETHAVANPNP
jgi:hypothetical protein